MNLRFRPRPLCLCITVCLLLPAVAVAEVPWLAEVTTPPPEAEALPKPAPLLITAEGEPIDTAAEWQKKREQFRAAWLKFLGPLPEQPEPLAIETLSEERVGAVVRKKIRYFAEPGRKVEAYLLAPATKSDTKRPGVVVFHATTPLTIDTVGGVAGDPGRHLGLMLAQRGFVAICPANFLWEEKSLIASTERVKQRHPQSKGMATTLSDGMRAVDVLLAQPNVDPQRIVTIGHSLGAKEVLYLLAFDERVAAGVASEGGIALDSTNWEAEWYLGPEIRNPGFPHNHHELVALIAPRPFLVLGGESGKGCADGSRSWPYLLPGQQVSRLLGEPVRIGLLNHGQGHSLPADATQKAFEWLEAAVE